MYRSTRFLIVAVVAILATIIVAPMATYASANGDKNTAIGLGVIGAVLLGNGKTVPGLLALAGAGYAYNQYQNDRDQERYWDGHRWQYRARDIRSDRDVRLNNDRRDDNSRSNGWERSRDRQSSSGRFGGDRNRH